MAELQVADLVSQHARCIIGVTLAIRALELDGFAKDRVFPRTLPTDQGVIGTQETGGTRPAIVVSLPPDYAENWGAGTNITEDHESPILVTFLAAGNRDVSVDKEVDLLLMARQKVLLKFHNKRLSGVDEIDNCEVQPGPIILSDAFESANLIVSPLVIMCRARQARTA